MRNTLEYPQEESSGKFVALIISLVLLVVCLGGYFAYQGIKGLLVDLREKYTDTTPLELPEPSASDTQAASVLSRVDLFTSALEDGGSSSALILTAEEINILINRHPSWRDIAGKVHVEIKEDKIHGTVSVPLDQMSDFLKGRFLNGNAVFRVSLNNDLLEVYVESVVINGKELPGKVLKSIRSSNLAEDANTDKESRDVFRKIQSITVSDGKLIILPKSVIQ